MLADVANGASKTQEGVESGIAFAEYRYKTAPQGELFATVYYPEDWAAEDSRTAILFFGGGGWRFQTRQQFLPHSLVFAEAGILAICAEYRTKDKHDTAVSDCIEDARSAIRWAKMNAPALGVDPSRVLAAGGSAGGYLALCAALDLGSDAEDEDESISTIPVAAVGFNPVYDPTDLKPPASQPGGFRLGKDPAAISPYHHIAAGQPPMVVFHGTRDQDVSYAQAAAFSERYNDAGNHCLLHPAHGQEHGFFNEKRSLEQNDGKWYRACVEWARAFVVGVTAGDGPVRVDERDESVSSICSITRNLVYKETGNPESMYSSAGVETFPVPGRCCALDIYQPIGGTGATQGNRPILVYIHGGGWRNGNKAIPRGGFQWEYMSALLSDGWVAASISYRLAWDDVNYPVPAEDCRDAVVWLTDHADEYGIDRNRIYLCGGSAGAHLALLVGLGSPGIGSAGRIRGIVSIYGPTDMVRMDEGRTPVGSEAVVNLMGAKYGEARDAYRAASPLTHLQSDSPPLLLLHGTADAIVPFEQAEFLRDAAEEKAVPVTLVSVTGGGHGESLYVGDRLSSTRGELSEEILSFLR